MHRARFPLVRQYDQLDCGPAALLSVLRYYGGDTTLVHARQLCRTDLQGTTLLDMLRAARAMGFAACGARGTYDDLLRESMPCIAHVLLPEGLSHYLIIYRIGTERLLVGDPGKGRYTLSRGEFETMWRERAVLLLTPAGNGSAEIPPEEAQAVGGQANLKAAGHESGQASRGVDGHADGRAAGGAAIGRVRQVMTRIGPWLRGVAATRTGRSRHRAAGLLQESSPGWLRWIGAYLLQQRAWLQQILFTGVICTGAGLLTALFVQTLIDRLIPARATDKLLFLAAALLGVLILRAAIGYLRDRLLVTANKRLSLAVTNDFLLHLFRLPKDFFDSRKTGDITARIDDSLRIHRTCLLLMQSALLDFFLVLGALLFIFYFSVALGLLTLAMLPVYIAVLWRQGRRLKGGQREVMQSHAIVDSTWIDSIQGMPEIMSFNAAPAFTRLNQGAFSRFQDQLERLGLMQAGLNLMVGLLGAVISVSLLGLGAWQVMAGRLLLGQFMAAWSLLGYLLPAVTSLVAAYIEFQGAEVAAQRLMELLLVETEADSTPLAVTREVVGIPDQKPEPQGPGIGRKLAAADPVQNPPAAAPAAVPGVTGGTSPLLRVEALSFAWPKSPPLLRELSLALPAGRVTGLWGASGAGKSTLVQLLQRKYPPLAGAIFWQGVALEEIALQEVRRRIGVVPQQIRIFNATLAENLLLGRPAASLQEISTRLDELGLESLPGRFVHGLLTLLGEEGRKLSGGETQLLALARALWGRPPLLVIDEGFSAIDVDLECTLQGLISGWGRRHAVLLITHNLESLRRTDYIYLLQEGRIAEEGAPGELLGRGGVFRELMRRKNGMLAAAAGGWS